MTELEKEMLDKVGATEADTKPQEVSQLDRVEAQTLYTALMTDTLLEE